MALSGQARTQALQRVQTSRSIGFSCRHSTSKAPSQPESALTFPDQRGNLCSSGTSPLPVSSTLTSSWPDNRSAQSSAASPGPITRTWPPDLNSTAGAGAGSGNAAIATRAAIFGVARAPSADQPACSRRFTNLIFDSGASSPKSGASWVQATMSSSEAPSADWNAPTSLRQSWCCTLTGSPDFSAAPSALTSSATVRLQLQTLSVLPSRLIVFGFFLDCVLRARLVFFLLLVLVEDQRARLVERRQHLLGNRLAAGPVAGIRFERIGRIEMRIAEKLLQRGAAQLVLDLRMHEA